MDGSVGRRCCAIQLEGAIKAARRKRRPGAILYGDALTFPEEPGGSARRRPLMRLSDLLTTTE